MNYGYQIIENFDARLENGTSPRNMMIDLKFSLKN